MEKEHSFNESIAEDLSFNSILAKYQEEKQRRVLLEKQLKVYQNLIDKNSTQHSFGSYYSDSNKSDNSTHSSSSVPDFFLNSSSPSSSNSNSNENINSVSLNEDIPKTSKSRLHRTKSKHQTISQNVPKNEVLGYTEELKKSNNHNINNENYHINNNNNTSIRSLGSSKAPTEEKTNENSNLHNNSSKVNKKPKIFDTDWNSRFQNALKMVSESSSCKNIKERSSILSHLCDVAEDFIYSARTYARIIISEVVLPDSLKTIKPLPIGGLAGGDKYLTNNILFKFALDSNNLFASDESAAKVAAHELKGISALFSCILELGIQNLCLPIVCLVDYRGFRIVAISVLPISGSTIQYGSNNYGKNINKTNSQLCESLKLIGKNLNLKPHIVNGVEIYTPVDLEAHTARDGRHYIIDCSRLMPPTKPEKNIRCEYLIHLFRQEFIRRYHKPLNPDAFSPFGKEDNLRVHNQEIEEATLYLYNEIIPQFSNELVHLANKLFAKGLKRLTHNHGINIRMLGRCRSSIAPYFQYHRFIILLECVSRVIKNAIRAKLRKTAKQSEGIGESSYKKSVIKIMNLVFSDGEDSQNYWNGPLKQWIQEKFQYIFSSSELLSTFDLKKEFIKFKQEEPLAVTDNKSIDGRSLLFARVTELLNLKFHKSKADQLLLSTKLFSIKKGTTELFDTMDLEEIGEVVKHLNFVNYASGYLCMFKAWKRSRTSEEFLHLSWSASQHFQEALETMPNNCDLLLNCADVVLGLGQIERAERYYKRAISLNPNHVSGLFKYATFLRNPKRNRIQEAEVYYRRCLTIDPNHIECFRSYKKLLKQFPEYVENAEKFLKEIKSRPDFMELKNNYATFLDFLPPPNAPTEVYIN